MIQKTRTAKQVKRDEYSDDDDRNNKTTGNGNKIF